MDNLHLVFGLPVYQNNLSSEKYQRQNILNTIKHNYSIDKKRQEWTKNHYDTDIHHSIKDENNNKFLDIDYSCLETIYTKHVKKYFELLKVKQNFKFNVEIVNYTASKENTFMEPHLHTNCEFSLIHHLSFDPKQHNPTFFESPYCFRGLIPGESKLKHLNADLVAMSWLYETWRFNIKEDDVIIFPGIFRHFVRNKKSNDLRVTIVANVRVED